MAGGTEVSETQQLAFLLCCSLEEAGQLLVVKGKDKGNKGKGKAYGRTKGGGTGDYGKGAPAQGQQGKEQETW